MDGASPIQTRTGLVYVPSASSVGLPALFHCLLGIFLQPLAQLHGMLRCQDEGRLDLARHLAPRDLLAGFAEVHLAALVDLMAHVVRNAGPFDVQIGHDRGPVGVGPPCAPVAAMVRTSSVSS